MCERGILVSNAFVQQQRCFLSYTGFEGRVHSTMQGHGWNDEGIEAFNHHLMFVVEDREKYGSKFEDELKTHCEKALGVKRSNASSWKRKKEASNPPEKRKRCLGARDLLKMKATIAAQKEKNRDDISSTHATVDNSNNNNEEEEEQVNRKEYKEFEKDTYASTNADDHLADLN